MNLLITSVGRRSYMVTYFRAAMQSAGIQGEIHVSNSSPISPAFRLADKATVTPIVYSDEYIPFLLDYCKKNNIHAIISLFDIDLPVLAKNKAAFNKIGVRLVVSEFPVVDICNDKWKTYNFLKNAGVGTPETWLSVDEALRAIRGGSSRWPVIVKPRWGIGSIGVQKAYDEEELDFFCRVVNREIRNTHLKYESAASSRAVLIQEYVDGEEYGLDVINDLEGNYRAAIVKKKYGMRSGETDCAEVVEDRDIAEAGKTISEKFRHYGNLDVDVIKQNGNLYVVDMNARFGGGYPFSHVAGVNLPLAIVKWLEGKDIAMDILTAEIGVLAQKDIAMVRY